MDSEPHLVAVADTSEGRHTPGRGVGMWGAHLTASGRGKVPSDRLALKPYWGKPAVRNFRGGDGNAGIIEARTAPLPYPACSLTSCCDWLGESPNDGRFPVRPSSLTPNAAWRQVA